MTVFLLGTLLLGAAPCLAAAAALAGRGVWGSADGGPAARGRDLWLAAWLVAVVSLVAPYAVDLVTWPAAQSGLVYLPLFNPFLFGAATLGYTTALTRPSGLRRSAWFLAPAVLAFGLGLWVSARSVWGGVPDSQAVTGAVRGAFYLAVAFNVACLAIAAWLAAASSHVPGASASEAAPRRWAVRFATIAGATTAVWAGMWVAGAFGAEFSTRAQWWPNAAALALAYPVGWVGLGAHRPRAVARPGGQAGADGVVGQLRGSAFLSFPVLTIGGLSVWLVAYGSSCTGFDCLGIGPLILAGLSVTALQVVVLVPAVWYRRTRVGRPFGAAAAVWVSASVGAFLAGIAALRALS